MTPERLQRAKRGQTPPIRSRWKRRLVHDGCHHPVPKTICPLFPLKSGYRGCTDSRQSQKLGSIYSPCTKSPLSRSVGATAPRGFAARRSSRAIYKYIYINIHIYGGLEHSRRELRSATTSQICLYPGKGAKNPFAITTCAQAYAAKRSATPTPLRKPPKTST